MKTKNYLLIFIAYILFTNCIKDSFTQKTNLKKEEESSKVFEKVQDVQISEEELFTLMKIFGNKKFYDLSPISAKKIIRRMKNDKEYALFNKNHERNLKRKNRAFDETMLFSSEDENQHDKLLKNKLSLMENTSNTKFFEDSYGVIGRKGFLSYIKEDKIHKLWCIVNSKVFSCFNLDTMKIYITLRVSRISSNFSIGSPCFFLNEKIGSKINAYSFCSYSDKESLLWEKEFIYLNSVN